MNHIETFKPMSPTKIAGIFAALVLTLVTLLSLGFSQSASASQDADTAATVTDHTVGTDEGDYVDGCVIVGDETLGGVVVSIDEINAEELVEFGEGELVELTDEELAELEDNGFVEFLEDGTDGVEFDADDHANIEEVLPEDIDPEDFVDAEELILGEGDFEECSDLSDEEIAELEAAMALWEPFDECVQSIYGIDEDIEVSSDALAKELDCVEKAPVEEQEALRASIEQFLPFEECLDSNLSDIEDESFEAALEACEHLFPEDLLLEGDDWAEAELVTEEA